MTAPNNAPIPPVWEEEQPLSRQSCMEEEAASSAEEAGGEGRAGGRGGGGEEELMINFNNVLISIDWNYRSRTIRAPASTKRNY